MKPQPYDMNKKEDVKRWFEEMQGYLRTEDFIHQGTDLEGRKYALDGFLQLKSKLCEED